MAPAGRRRDPAYFAYRWFWDSLDWLYPPTCGGCGKPGSRWCSACQLVTHTIGGNICALCGQPMNGIGNRNCQNCQTSPPAFMALRSWAEFSGPLRQALHRLKYKKDIGLGEALSRPLMDWFRGLGWNVNLIVPVPLSNGRLRERGYNQVTYLARPFALGLGFEYQAKALTRTRDTPSQVGLNRPERRINVSGAFEANSSYVLGKSILVMDDVATTGATLESCSQALFRAGASEVYAITAARAIQF